MTPKSVIVINADEIKSVDIRCNACEASLTVPVTTQRLQHNLSCSNCGVELWKNSSPVQDATFSLIQALRKIGKDTSKAFSITFTLDFPSNSETKPTP